MLRRVDLYYLMGGDVFVEESPLRTTRRTYQVVSRKEGDPTYIYARDLETGRVYRFFYKDSAYAPKVFLKTEVNSNERLSKRSTQSLQN